MRARDARGFMRSIGVNTHLGDLDTPQANAAVVMTALAYLRVTYVRDVAPDRQMLHTYRRLAARGIRFNLIATPYDTDVARALPGNLAMIERLQSAWPGSVIAVEGPNEVNAPVNNVTYRGTPASSSPAVATRIMQAIHGAVRRNRILRDVPVLNLSVSGGEPGWEEYLAAMGNLSAVIDRNSGSVYPHFGDQPAAWLKRYLSIQARPAPGKPMIIREVGYCTNTRVTAQPSGVDAPTQARQTLNLLADAFTMGVRHTYIYQLLDDFDDPTASSDIFGSCGLFYSDGTPKPAATAIHNLTSILADSGSAAKGFATGSLAYSIANLPANGNSLLLEKSNGAFDIMAWAEPNNWNASSKTEINVPSVSTSVNLGGTYQTVEVFDPLQGTSPIQTLTNVSSVTLGLTDHPLIVEVEPRSFGRPAGRDAVMRGRAP